MLQLLLLLDVSIIFYSLYILTRDSCFLLFFAAVSQLAVHALCPLAALPSPAAHALCFLPVAFYRTGVVPDVCCRGAATVRVS